ncbi:MAG: hypothetical protein Q8N47_10500 [Bryobacterales bacterium]|nr:hypothetical protein [Bryobacterales bacterium]
MLEDLTSCNIETRSKPGWLVAGGVAGGYMALWAVSSGDPGKFVAGVLLAALCLVAYVLTRRKIMVLRSASEGIELNVSGDSWDSLKAFVDAVQTAKHERLMLLAQDRGQERR